MKKSRIFIVLFVCLAVVLALSACGKDADPASPTGGTAKEPKVSISPEAVVSVSDAAQLIGTWVSAPIDFTDEINQQLASQISEDSIGYFHVDDYSYSLRFVFSQEGLFAMTPESSTVDAAVDNVKEVLRKGYTDMYTDTAASVGANVEDVVHAIGYDSLDALVEYCLTAFDFEQIKFNISAPLNISGNYDVVDGKLVIVSSNIGSTDLCSLDAGFKSGRLFLIPSEDPDQPRLFDQTLTLVKTE